MIEARRFSGVTKFQSTAHVLKNVVAREQLPPEHRLPMQLEFRGDFPLKNIVYSQ